MPGGAVPAPPIDVHAPAGAPLAKARSQTARSVPIAAAWIEGVPGMAAAAGAEVIRPPSETGPVQVPPLWVNAARLLSLARSNTVSCCAPGAARSEEHTSELQSQSKLVCR